MSEGSIGIPCEFIAKGFGVKVNPATEIELSTDGKKFRTCLVYKMSMATYDKTTKNNCFTVWRIRFSLFFALEKKHFVLNFKKESLQKHCCYCIVRPELLYNVQQSVSGI